MVGTTWSPDNTLSIMFVGQLLLHTQRLSNSLSCRWTFLRSNVRVAKWPLRQEYIRYCEVLNKSIQTFERSLPKFRRGSKTHDYEGIFDPVGSVLGPLYTSYTGTAHQNEIPLERKIHQKQIPSERNFSIFIEPVRVKVNVETVRLCTSAVWCPS